MASSLSQSSSSSSSKSSSKSSKSSASASDMTRRMICGGVAGMIAKTATNPLDRIRMLSQTGEHGIVMGTTMTDTAATTTTTTTAASAGKSNLRPTHKVGVVTLYKNIIQREGIAGLWAGNGANLLRVFPAKAVVFSSNDFFRKLFLSLDPNENSNGKSKSLNSTLSFLAGGLSGMTATAATYPLDLARGRISGKLASPTTTPSASTNRSNTTIIMKPNKEYHGIIHTLVLTVRDEGIRGLYKGVTPTLLGAMPYEGIKFGTVGLLENLFPIQEQQQPPSKDQSNHTSTTNLAMRKMVFGGMGGIMAGLITYPNDTVRRMMQLQGSRGTTTHYTGYMDCVIQIYRQHGISRFYTGVGINMVRMAPNTAVQFGSYELLKQWSSEWGI